MIAFMEDRADIKIKEGIKNRWVIKSPTDAEFRLNSLFELVSTGIDFDLVTDINEVRY